MPDTRPDRGVTIEVAASLARRCAQRLEPARRRRSVSAPRVPPRAARDRLRLRRTGWTPQFLMLRETGGVLAGAMPLYLKSHSYGEYVFDWAWADAYQRHGCRLLPQAARGRSVHAGHGPRLLARSATTAVGCSRAALDAGPRAGVSSLHCLFPPRRQDQRHMSRPRHDAAPRRAVPLGKPGYASFDEFLASFNHDKRKKIQQERRKVQRAGIRFRRLRGDEISERDWAFFYRCYRQTYREHHSTPYLNLDFFQRLGETMPRDICCSSSPNATGEPIARAQRARRRHAVRPLLGRARIPPCLHFEACYYQAIEFCIERGIEEFEGGAQGEHKLARGLLPVETLLGALARAPGIRNGHRAFPRARDSGRRALRRRTQ